MGQSDNPFNVTDWAALQRQYLDALHALGFPGAPGATPGSNPWQNALDYWWQGASATVPAEQRALFAELVRQSRGFPACADFFAPLTAALSRQPVGGSDWDREVRRQFEALQQQLAAGQVAPGMESLLGAWKLPSDLWQQTSALFERLPEAWLRPASGAAVSPGQQAAAAEALRQGAGLWWTYQQAQAEYVRMLSDGARNGLDKLQERLLGGVQVHSLRELYDLWVDCGETAFGEMMAGAEFANCYAALVNALSAFKLHTRQLIDAGLDALSLPTAQALGTVQQREAGMRTELRAAQARQQEDRETLMRVQRELKTLRRAVPKATPAQGSGAED